MHIRPEYRVVWLFQVLALGAVIASGIALLSRANAIQLRHQYLQKHGEIDIPEAMYFDHQAMSISLPTFVIWLFLQITSVVSFFRKVRSVGNAAQLVFWGLWLYALGMWFM